MGVLAAYSITVKELKTLFAALHGKQGRWVSLIAIVLWILLFLTKIEVAHSRYERGKTIKLLYTTLDNFQWLLKLLHFE